LKPENVVLFETVFRHCGFVWLGQSYVFETLISHLILQ
jgi:hypothetical protein